MNSHKPHTAIDEELEFLRSAALFLNHADYPTRCRVLDYLESRHDERSRAELAVAEGLFSVAAMLNWPRIARRT